MIAVGCDHAGYELKREVISHLTEKGYEIMDLGCNGESCDYPLIANEVADNILNKKCDKGILICGTGIGMSIAANKIHGIRAALCSDYFSAKYTRLHNDANVMCIGARTIGVGLALELADVFFGNGIRGRTPSKKIRFNS